MLEKKEVKDAEEDYNISSLFPFEVFESAEMCEVMNKGERKKGIEW